MKKVGFVGGYDKTNLIMYTAKTLENMGNRVLVIDGTILQKCRFVVPTVSQAKLYITEFEKIDFAVGFQGIDQIMQYLQIETMTGEDLPYDFILVDVDNRIALKSFDVLEYDHLFFVTGFDVYSLKRGMDILSKLEYTIKMTKILCSNNITKEEEEYLNYLSLETKVEWDPEVIYCPKLEIDNKILEENERVEKLRLKRLSNDYQKAIYYVVQKITDGQKIGKIKKNVIE